MMRNFLAVILAVCSLSSVYAETGQVDFGMWVNNPYNNFNYLPALFQYLESIPPTVSRTLTSFDTGEYLGDNYTGRLSGWLTPPTTGDYTFWVASDDSSHLWLSTSADPNDAQLLAYVNGWTPYRDWYRESSQQSQAVALQAGQAYWIDAIYHEGTGGDHLAVAWQGPGVGFQIIPGQYLSNTPPIIWGAGNPVPADQTRGVRPGPVVVSWSNEGEFPAELDHYRVYFGETTTSFGDPDYVAAEIPASGPFEWYAGTLLAGTRYYWRVDAVLVDQRIGRGFTWTFETGAEPIEACPPGDISGDCQVDMEDVLLFAGQWLDGPGCEGNPVLCADLVGDDGVNLGDYEVLSRGWGAKVGPVVINEIHVDPDVKTELVEFVELYNPSRQPVELSYWYFSSGVDFVFGPDSYIQPDSYIVLAQNSEEFQQKFGFEPYGEFTGKLSNEGETLELRDPSGRTVDQVDFKIGFPWPTVGDPPGNSMQLINASFANDVGGAWRGALPTPGGINVVASKTAPPMIRKVAHTPQQPRAAQPVVVTATVTDPDGVQHVLLQYQIVEPGDYIPLHDSRYNSDWTTTRMYDDGTHGDEEAGDDIYSVTIYASRQRHRRLIRYRINAADNTGRSVTAPYDDDPCPNFTYFVYNGVPSWTGAIRPGSDTPITYDTDVMNSLPVYHLISKKADVENATWYSQYMGSEYQWWGALVYDGEVYDHIRYRMRGGVWRYAMGKNMWKFDFNRGHYFQARDDYGDKYDATWDKLNFSACIQQGDYLHRGEQGMFEAVGFKFFNLMGVEAPKTHWLQFRIIDEASETGANQYGGDLWGLYLAIEQMDGRFLDEHGLPDGNLYKIEGHNGELNNQGPTAVTNGSDFAAFKSGYYYDPNPSQQWWRDNVNLDSYYSYRCVVEGIHHGDIGYGKNYFFYLNPETNLWSMLPWDLDLTWANNMFGNGEEPFKNEGQIFSNQALRIEYDNRLREFHDLFYNADQAWQLIEEYAAVIDPPGQEHAFVDVDRRMWDYHPIKSSGLVNAGKASAHFYERAATGDFRGMVKIMKDYVADGPRQFDSYYEDTSIPSTPQIEYTGQGEYAVNDLTFRTSPFSDPQGAGTFAAMQWRIAEVHPASRTVTDPGDSGMQTLFPQSSSWRLFKGFEEPSSVTGAWRQIDFNDDPATSDWFAGNTPAGYGNDMAMNTPLPDLESDQYYSFYLRKDFQISDPAAVTSLKLYVAYDDGFNAWINGHRVAWDNVPQENLPHDTLLGDYGYSAREDSSYVEFTLPDPNFLVAGTNTIAVHVLNVVTNSSDCFFDAYLVAEFGDSGGGQEPQVVVGEPGKYEIKADWQSEPSSAFEETARIPASEVKVGRTYRVRCRMKDTSGRWSHWSQPVQFVTTPAISAGIRDSLRITEVMYNPAAEPVLQDFDSDDYEFIELKNVGDEPVDLQYVSLTDGVEFAFAGSSITSLDPGEIALIVQNRDAFLQRYGTEHQDRIAGEFASGKLANNGENIRLEDYWQGTIIEFEYGDSRAWPIAADGAGHSLVPRPSALGGQASGSLEYPGHWRASTYIGGSPGQDDPEPAAGVVLNEIMAHTDYTDPSDPRIDSNDWIELYNAGDSAVVLADWYLSDDPDDLRKWRIPQTTLESGGFAHFDEITGFHSPFPAGFGLNKSGEQVFLSCLPGDETDRVVDCIRFKGQDNDISLGRWPDGGEYWLHMSPTRGTANQQPDAPAVVVSEIMYHPAEGGEEYIELYNTTDQPVALSNATGPWRLDGAIEFQFPTSTVIEPQGRLLIVDFDPSVDTDRFAAFQDRYGTGTLVPGTDIVGSWSGDLNNDTGRIGLEKPLEPDLPDTDIPWMIVDEPTYFDRDPWPTEPDGGNRSLHRTPLGAPAGPDPANWQSAPPSPGE